MSRSPDPVRLQLWNDRIVRCKQSSLTIAEFCRVEAVPVSSFNQWKKKLAASPQQPSLSPPQFLPVRIAAAPPAAMPVIKLAHGVSIDLPVDLHRRQLCDPLVACIDATLSHQSLETQR